MNPVEPRLPIAPGWRSATYAKTQREYNPLPSLIGTSPDQRSGGEISDLVTVPVVSVWEPTTDEINALRKMLDEFDERGGPAPRFSLMLLTFGQPLQPIRLVVGEFQEPYEMPAPAEAGNAPLA